MGFQFCPHCGGKLPSSDGAERSKKSDEGETTPRVYDGPKYWRALIERSQFNRHLPLDVARATKRIVEDASKMMKLDGVVHLLLDRDVVPRGGVFLEAARVLSMPNHQNQLVGPSAEMREAFLRDHGYVVEGGTVTMVNDIPIGRAYQVLEEWGGHEHFSDWNMSDEIDLQPSRSGVPFFFDENMICFGVHFQRTDDIEPALLALFARFESESVGGLVDIGVFWR